MRRSVFDGIEKKALAPVIDSPINVASLNYAGRPDVDLELVEPTTVKVWFDDAG